MKFSKYVSFIIIYVFVLWAIVFVFFMVFQLLLEIFLDYVYLNNKSVYIVNDFLNFE